MKHFVKVMTTLLIVGLLSYWIDAHYEGEKKDALIKVLRESNNHLLEETMYGKAGDHKSFDVVVRRGSTLEREWMIPSKPPTFPDNRLVWVWAFNKTNMPPGEWALAVKSDLGDTNNTGFDTAIITLR